MKKRSRWILLALLLSMLQTSVAGQEKETDSASKDQGPPPVTSPWRAHDYRHEPKQVLEALLDLVRQDGLTLLEEDREKGTFRTDRIEFDETKFGKANVALPPPEPSPQYPYFGLNEMTFGHFGLAARSRSRGPGNTRLQLQALLEAPAFHGRTKTKAWVPRISNGYIEGNYFARLTQRLESPPDTSDSPTPN